tara:strand:- start:1382 stop:1843 length:462 start_codon:yes stop_codon:yes gene_type:complete
MSEIKEEYEKLKKKYDFPEFKVMDNELELSSLDNSTFLLRKIRRRMNDKLVFFCRVLEGVLFPNAQSLVNIQESKFFSDEDKERISKFYKEMMVYERRALELDVKPNDKEEVVLIKELYKDWPRLTKEVAEISSKMKEGWKEEIAKKDEQYFG